MTEPRILKGENHFTEGELPLRVLTVRHDETITPHAHDFVELVFFASGTASHERAPDIHTESVTEPVEAGDLLIIPIGHLHAYVDPKDAVIYNVLFDPEAIRDVLPQLKAIEGFMDLMVVEPFFRSEVGIRNRLHLSPKDAEAVESLLCELQQEMESREPGFEPVAKGLLVKLLVYASRAYARRKLPETEGAEILGKRSIIYECMGYIEKHHARELSVSELAAQAYLSPDYFARVFKKLVGRTPTEYVNSVRLEKAREHLVRSRKPVTEIAYEVGYHDPAYFSRLFRREFDSSPSEFRKLSDMSNTRTESS